MNLSKKNIKINKFIKILYSILNNKQYNNIISWSNNGNSFTIFDMNMFKQNILMIYFKYDNLSNFIRQLNYYSFYKLKNNLFSYANENFLQYDESKLGFIQKKRNHKNKHSLNFNINTIYDINNNLDINNVDNSLLPYSNKKSYNLNNENFKINDKNEKYVSLLEKFIEYILYETDNINKNNCFINNNINDMEENKIFPITILKSSSTNIFLEELRLKIKSLSENLLNMNDKPITDIRKFSYKNDNQNEGNLNMSFKSIISNKNTIKYNENEYLLEDFLKNTISENNSIDEVNKNEEDNSFMSKKYFLYNNYDKYE